jgi:hypothetical protein
MLQHNKSSSMYLYNLRTLLISVAVIPPMIAAVWYLLGYGNETYRRSLRADSVIRDELLAATPPGTPASKVIAYANRELEYGPSDSYSDSFLAGKPGTRSATVGLRAVHFAATEYVTATWHFDANNRLTDISIARRTVWL